MIGTCRNATIAGIAVASLALVPLVWIGGGDLAHAAGRPAAGKRSGADAAGCARRAARGWAPGTHHARLAAWEKVARATGNWPLPAGTLRTVRYACKPAHGGVDCTGYFLVCGTR